MRLFLWILGIFASTASLAVLVRFNVGNVVLFFPPYRVDISLNFFILVLILSFVVLYLFLRAVENTRKMPERVASYRGKKREQKSSRALREAIKALFEGRFVYAEKAAKEAAELPENAGCATLIAARAAHALQQFKRRDEYLEQVRKDNDFKVASLITSMELLVDDHQTKAALKAIEELNADGARHVHVQRWALKAHQQAKNWKEVLRIVKLLDKHHAIRPALSVRLRELAYEDLLSAPHDTESIRRLWKSIPSEDCKRPYIAVRAARAFQACGLDDEARELLEKVLDVEWDDRLIKAYRESASTADMAILLKQVERCEAWLEKHPNDVELLLSLGVLCFRQKLWGKARRYLDNVIYLRPEDELLKEAQLTLAQLHEVLEQPEEAAQYYRASALGKKL